MSCGGVIFNRHQWNYLDKYNRICERCGECETNLIDFWHSTNLQKLLEKTETWKERKKTQEKNRREALDYLQSFDTTARDKQ